MMTKRQLIVIWILFVISRFYVLANPPYRQITVNDKVESIGYSDVQHDSERYANMWYYGLIPYRQHLFEYPPAAIPIMFMPLLVDQAKIGYYYLDYRVQIFIFEIILFTGISYTVSHLPFSKKQKWLALGFYILAGALAKDFWYDGLDLMFIGSLTLGIIWRLWHNYQKRSHRVIFWALFWLSVAIKLLTVPLILPFAWIKKRQWRRELVAIFGGGLIIWLIPLLMFRSSLSVFLFFHGTRPIKYESLANWAILAVNDFTKSEHQTQIAPHFPMAGPFTQVMERTTTYAFPLAIILVMVWSTWITKKINLEEPHHRLKVFHYLIKITLVYLFTIFVTSKIFSRPFHIWYVPLIAIYPFKNWRQQVLFIIGALLMLALDTTPYLKVPQIYFGLVPLQRIRDAFRFIPMFILLALSIKLPEPVWELPSTPGKMKS